MKKNSIIALISFAAVIAFALIWNLTSGALSIIGAALTMLAGITFVVSVNKLSGTVKVESSATDSARDYTAKHAA